MWPEGARQHVAELRIRWDLEAVRLLVLRFLEALDREDDDDEEIQSAPTNPYDLLMPFSEAIAGKVADRSRLRASQRRGETRSEEVDGTAGHSASGARDERSRAASPGDRDQEGTICGGDRDAAFRCSEVARGSSDEVRRPIKPLAVNEALV
jgi:hypothetical protein